MKKSLEKVRKIGIIGCGWLGIRIANHLKDNFEIYTTTTSVGKMDLLTEKGLHPTLVNFEDPANDTKLSQWNMIPDLDSLIVTVSFSERYEDSSVLYQRSHQLKNFIGDYKRQLFFMSSTGVYPLIDKVFKEEDVAVNTVFGEEMIRARYPQVNILRLAGLMGSDRLLQNYKISNVNQPVNHVHYQDIALVIEKMIKQQSRANLFNVVAPIHPTKAEVIDAQKDIPFESMSQIKGRIISSKKMMESLDFDFQFPDPRLFHLS